MKQVVIATKNRGKVKDFETLFQPLGYEVVTMFDVAPNMEIEETGTTFEENAVLKAEALSKALNKMVIADDSGLAIDALDGEPGVYSARYAGDHDDEANIQKVLANLEGVQERTARFVCVIAVATPSQATYTVRGECVGEITTAKKGDNGFGYDPIFYVPTLEKTMAQLTAEQKASVSHRGNALRKLQDKLGESK